MNEKKQQKAEYLLSELEGVHDVYLQEALTWKKQRMDWKIPTAIAASVLALLIALPLLRTLIVPEGPDVDADVNPPQIDLEGSDPPMDDSADDQTPTSPTTPKTLDAVLLAATPHSTVESSDALSYFGGGSYLVWQTAGEETFSRSRALTTAEVGRILYLIGRGEAVGEVSPTPISRVWLVLGDGTVWTPYLPVTSGNSGAAVLFDYNAELLPSEALISCISGILGLQ